MIPISKCIYIDNLSVRDIFNDIIKKMILLKKSLQEFNDINIKL